ncbi:hypothetical protein G7Y89_g11656 [Cudoniella acicularis]|uniref:Carboxymuconolactone decarboxylase-like domain-containing protein n=1 Tax=Cudoniella acicularis TaxID=354080 RepID=A0A8H4W0G2_9HELO|nr:hypothetical protein G7Y89_g11656 [Cudoniella acicularis]
MYEILSKLQLRSAVTSLSGLVCVDPHHVGTLYTYLISKPEFATSDSRKALIRRIREALVKNISIQGVVKPISALFSIVEIEKPEDKDYSFSREGWQTGPENVERGNAWLSCIYKGNLDDAVRRFAAHRDFEFISRQITYGLYLSDHSILDGLSTELIVLSGIMIQNQALETAWHLRGTRRVGASQEDVELIQQCVELVAQFGRININKMPRVTDIEAEV